MLQTTPLTTVQVNTTCIDMWHSKENVKLYRQNEKSNATWK